MHPRRNQLRKPAFTCSSSSLNSTVLDTTRSQLSTPSYYEENVDDIELKLNYDEYQTAHLKALILQRHMEKTEQAATDQLSIFLDKLTDSEVEEYNLETEISILESQMDSNIEVNELRTQQDESTSILNAQVHQQIDLITNLLDSALNKLYLGKFHAIDDQESFDSLEKMIAISSGQIKKLLVGAGKIDGLNELRNAIVALKKSQCNVEEYCKKFEDTEHMILASTLRKISDMLAGSFPNSMVN